MIINIENY